MMGNNKARIMLRVALLFICYGLVTGRNCKDGWMTYHNSCYLFARNHTSNFTDAEHYCRQQGGHLIELETKSENLFIRDYLHGLKSEYHWLGITDKIVDGMWKWYTSDTDATYTDWSPGEPDSHGGTEDEDCAGFAYRADYRWFDVPCSLSMEPICEIESGEVSIVG